MLKKFFNLAAWGRSIVAFIRIIPTIPKTAYLFTTFFLMLLFFMIGKINGVFEKIPLIGRFFSAIRQTFNKTIHGPFAGLVAKLEKSRISEVERNYLIALALQNLMAKKTRTFVTILGMSFGVGIIVLLLSLGYGIEKLVINKVAGLDELKIVDVSIGENTTLSLNEALLKKIQKITDVNKIVPLISIVSKITYQKSQTDVVAYATTKDYLDLLKVKVLKGKLFVEDTGFKPISLGSGSVAGARTVIVDGIYDRQITGSNLNFNILPGASILAWEKCSIKSKGLGFVKRFEGGDYAGREHWGESYAPFNDKGREAYDEARNMYLGRWIKATVPLFEMTEKDEMKSMLDNNGSQKWQEVCLQENNIQITQDLAFAEVLGESTEIEEEILSEFVLSEETTSTDSATAVVNDSAEPVDSGVKVSTNAAGIEFVELAASDSAKKKEKASIKYIKPPSKQAVVSTGMLNLLNIKMGEAVGKKFKTAFVIVKSLRSDVEGRAVSPEEEFEITGVIEDDEAPYFYIPLSDAYKLGINNFSQLKVVMKAKELLAKVRKEIETFGFRTNSTADTVNQIESLFANLRIVLGMLGLVALGVASLGMFNTLTVSLLERTREIGGMKAMGMVSEEVQDLFLAEAMIMGLSGGIGGLIIGFGSGKALSFLVSLLAMTRGQGYLSLSYVPPFLVIFILVSSFVVGIFTGLYPARRAKKISALNALRYE